MAADNRADKMSEDKPTLYATENAFQPAKEISNVDRFAGRAKPVAEAFLGLMAEGANIAIVGNRGIEKTSLARQVQNFGRGDNSLLEKLKLHYNHRFDFQVMYLACGNEIKDREALLGRLITSDRCLGGGCMIYPKQSE